MKTTATEYDEIEKKHQERIAFLRSKLVRGDWKEVIKICKKQGVEISDTPHAINILKRPTSKKHLPVFNALSQVVENRINQFKQS